MHPEEVLNHKNWKISHILMRVSPIYITKLTGVGWDSDPGHFFPFFFVCFVSLFFDMGSYWPRLDSN